MVDSEGSGVVYKEEEDSASFGEKREKIPKVVWVGQGVSRKRTGTFPH